MATNRHLTRLIAAGVIGLLLVATAPIAHGADPAWLKKARDASELLSGDQRECVESRIGRSNAERVENGRPTKTQATRYLSAVGTCSGGDALPCVRTTKKSRVFVTTRALPNVVTYQTPGVSPLLRPLDTGKPMGASNGFILADPTTGALPDGTHLLAFTGAQTAEGSPPGQEERSPMRRWILPALGGSEKTVTPIATDAVYELPNTWQSPQGLGVVGWWQIMTGESHAPVLLAMGRSTTTPRSQDNAIHAWRATDETLSQWTYVGQVIDASTLRQAAGGSFSDGAFDGARLASITFARTSPTSYRVYAGLLGGNGRNAGIASMMLDASGTGLPSITVDQGMRAARDEARVVPLIGPRGRTVGYAMGVGQPDKQSCLALSRDGLRFGDPVRGTTRSSMTLISSNSSRKSSASTWLALGSKSGPDVTDGITANWLDLVVRSAPPRPAITIGD